MVIQYRYHEFIDLCLLLPSDRMLSSFIAANFVWSRSLPVRPIPSDLYGAVATLKDTAEVLKISLAVVFKVNIKITGRPIELVTVIT